MTPWVKATLSHFDAMEALDKAKRNEEIERENARVTPEKIESIAMVAAKMAQEMAINNDSPVVKELAAKALELANATKARTGSRGGSQSKRRSVPTREATIYAKQRVAKKALEAACQCAAEAMRETINNQWGKL